MARSSSSRAISFSGVMAGAVVSRMGVTRLRNGKKCSTREALAGKPFDMGPALAELLLDALEAAVEMVNTADQCLALRGKPGDDQRYRGAEIRGHDLGAA